MDHRSCPEWGVKSNVETENPWEFGSLGSDFCQVPAIVGHSKFKRGGERFPGHQVTVHRFWLGLGGHDKFEFGVGLITAKQVLGLIAFSC